MIISVARWLPKYSFEKFISSIFACRPPTVTDWACSSQSAVAIISAMCVIRINKQGVVLFCSILFHLTSIYFISFFWHCLSFEHFLPSFNFPLQCSFIPFYSFSIFNLFLFLVLFNHMNCMWASMLVCSVYFTFQYCCSVFSFLFCIRSLIYLFYLIYSYSVLVFPFVVRQ